MISINSISSGSHGNCYVIDDGCTSVLIECGIHFKKIQISMNFQTSKLSGVLLSHSHSDHSFSIKDVLKNGLDVYMHQDTAHELKVSGHRVKIVEPKKQFKLGTFIVLPFDLRHDVTNIGYLLANNKGEKLLYVTDSYYVPYKFTGLTHIMIEANYSLDTLNANIDSGALPASMKNRLLKSHFSLDNMKDFLKANNLSKVQEIYLLHLSDRNSEADKFKREIQELTGRQVHIC